MPKALTTISGHVTAPSTTLTSWTLNTGDSLTLANADKSKKNYICDIWAANNVAGILEVRSPLMHDATHGIRNRILAAQVDPLFAPGVGQTIFPGDVLTVQHSGSGVAGAIEIGSLLVYYEDLPGASSHLIDSTELSKRMVNLLGQEIAITAAVTGDYGGSVAINNSFDEFKGNTEYAILGVLVDVRVGTVGIKGSDTSNLRIGCPGETVQRRENKYYFKRQSDAYGIPFIPVINSANKASTFIDVTNGQAAASPNVTLLMAQLS